MKTVFDIFTSKSRAVILQTLFFQKRPIPLRHISSISDIPIFSVQNAVNSLLNENLISKTEEDNNVLFELNKKHPLYNVLEQIFTIEMSARIRLEAKQFCQKAKQVLEFANAVGIIFKCTKKRGIK